MDDMLDNEKRFYERFWALHRDPQLVRVMQEFGIEPFRRSSVLEGLESFVAENDFSGKTCVEIGSWKGLTAVVLSRYFEEVISIDICPNEEKHAIAKFLGIDNIRFLDIKDNEEKATVINNLQFDAAFVDGDHARDTETDFALVRRCGHVLFHEYWEAQPAVMKLVNSLHPIVTKNKWALWTE